MLPEIRDTAGELGTLAHPSWPVELRLCGQTVDQQAALAGSGAVVPGRVKATYGTGVFVLAHVGEGCPEPAGGLLPTVAWTHRRADGVRARRWRVRGRGDARVAVPRARRSPPTRPRSASSPARPTDSGGAQVLPALAGIGAPVVAPERARGARRDLTAARPGRRSRARRSRGSPGGWPTSSTAIRESVDVDSLRVDGGVTNEPLMLELQADAIGVPVEAAGADATVLGAAALAAVGAGMIGSLAEAAELLPVDRVVEPTARRRLARGRARALARVRAGDRRARPALGEPGAAGYAGRVAPVSLRAAAALPARRLLFDDAHALVELDLPDRARVALVHAEHPSEASARAERARRPAACS